MGSASLWGLLAALLAALLPGRCQDECNLAPSTDELKTFCYEEIRACDEDPRCRDLLDNPDEVEPFPPPPKTFQVVMDCMKRTDDLKQAGWKPKRVRRNASPKPAPQPTTTRQKLQRRPDKEGKQLSCSTVQSQPDSVCGFSGQLCATLSWSCSATRAYSFWRICGRCCCINLTPRLKQQPCIWSTAS